MDDVEVVKVAEEPATAEDGEVLVCEWAEVAGGGGREGWVASRHIARGSMIIGAEDPLYIVYSMFQSYDAGPEACADAAIKWYRIQTKGLDEEQEAPLPSFRVMFLPKNIDEADKAFVDAMNPCATCMMAQKIGQTMAEGSIAAMTETFEAVPSSVPGGGCVQIYDNSITAQRARAFPLGKTTMTGTAPLRVSLDEETSETHIEREPNRIGADSGKCAALMQSETAKTGVDVGLLHRILDRNLIELRSVSVAYGTMGYGFYPRISRVAHRCLFPNAAFYNDTHRGYLIAMRDIAPGEEITRQYAYDPCKSHTDMRMHLFHQFGIHCHCEDCEDCVQLCENLAGEGSVVKALTELLGQYDACLRTHDMFTPSDASVAPRILDRVIATHGATTEHRLDITATHKVWNQVVTGLVFATRAEIRLVTSRYSLQSVVKSEIANGETAANVVGRSIEQTNRTVSSIFLDSDDGDDDDDKETADPGRAIREASNSQIRNDLVHLSALFSYLCNVMRIFTYQAHVTFLGQHLQSVADVLYAAMYILYRFDYQCGPQQVEFVHFIGAVGYSYHAYACNEQNANAEEFEERIDLAVRAHERLYSFMYKIIQNTDYAHRRLSMECAYSDIFSATMRLSPYANDRIAMPSVIRSIQSSVDKETTESWLGGTCVTVAAKQSKKKAVKKKKKTKRH